MRRRPVAASAWPIASVLCLPLLAQCFQYDSTNGLGKWLLDNNKQFPDMVELKSGLQLRVLRNGTGEDHPSMRSKMEFNWVATTPSLTPGARNLGDEKWKAFAGNVGAEPLTQRLIGQLPGPREALGMMVEGDKFELFVPSELAYGHQDHGTMVKSGDVLIMRYELLRIISDRKPAHRCNVETMEGCCEERRRFIEKFREEPEEKRKQELERLLRNEEERQSKAENLPWLMIRISLLKKMLPQEEPSKAAKAGGRAAPAATKAGGKAAPAAQPSPPSRGGGGSAKAEKKAAVGTKDEL